MLEYKVTITEADVYPSGYTVPEGYSKVGFGPPTKGQDYLLIGKGVATCDTDYSKNSPRIIVVVKPKPRRWTVNLVESTGKRDSKLLGDNISFGVYNMQIESVREV